MKILKSILNYIPLATFIIFVVTDGIFSLTSALIFVSDIERVSPFKVLALLKIPF